MLFLILCINLYMFISSCKRLQLFFLSHKEQLNFNSMALYEVVHAVHDDNEFPRNINKED